MTPESLRDDLVTLSHELGLEARQFALLGEGNTSVRCGDGTFWVKASGGRLGTLGAGGVSRVRLESVLTALEHDTLSEEEVETELVAALADPSHKKPSVETFLHALCLSEGGATWVGHTHTVSVNRILCSVQGAEPFRRHVFPDAIVVCGLHPAVVPYLDPGFALAKAVRLELHRFTTEHSHPPKLLLMENHGIVALGQSATEVLNIQLMADKWAKTLLGTYALGGPKFLPIDEAARIDNRLDEHYRRRALVRGQRE
ncbi:hypothetical protein BH24DEI2_BH24DEI2_05100 [soil metagenome]